MIHKNCKRLAEVDFPLSTVNEACVRENNRKTRIDSGHISLFHTWWARRPLASSRAILFSILLPDPTDPLCPKSFKETARKELMKIWDVGPSDADLKQALLDFISVLAEWDLAERNAYLTIARKLVHAAYGGSPHLFDPFAGGGSIPLEGLRLGCEVTAADLNPVAWLLLKMVLDWCARRGPELAYEFQKWSEWVIKETERRLAPYYPPDEEGRKAHAYLWARTIRCEAPGCGAIIPLIRDLWLSKARNRRKALRITYADKSDMPTIEIFSPVSEGEVAQGTVRYKFRVVCPRCHHPMARDRVQAQLREKRGGVADAILFAVVRANLQGRGKDYYPPDHRDLVALQIANEKAREINIDMPPFPQNDTRAFPPGAYGISTWADILTPRQRLSRWIIHQVIEDALFEAAKSIEDDELLLALRACLYVAYSDNAQYHTSLCVWLSEGVKSVFIQGNGVPMRADFVEGSPLSPNCEGLSYSIRSVASALRALAKGRYAAASPLLANALDTLLPDESVDIIFTDPPYADQVPYAHLSDFFYGWLRLGLKEYVPHIFFRSETEKAREITENHAFAADEVHDRDWYERRMYEAFGQMKKTMRDDGIAAVIFAHKDTDRWEALVSALISAGWMVTGSWPIATERAQRMRSQGYAALHTSVHLICRPRPDGAEVGDWAEVLRELPRRVLEWMRRLQAEGIRGADLVFACIGPALEIYSRYRRVETADGREVSLEEYLEKVWEVVGRAALQQVLGSADMENRDSTSGALEEDARLTAVFLWTLQSVNGGRVERTEDLELEVKVEEEEKGESGESGKRRYGGFTLAYDVVRRFAQPLGIHLPEWEGRIIETEKSDVRLLHVRERAKQLLGPDGGDSVAKVLERRSDGRLQLSLFDQDEVERGKIRVRGRGRGRKYGGGSPELASVGPKGLTTLDRVHLAMLLQATGRTNALRALLEAERERSPDFFRLANALSALYPPHSEEKRLIDAVLLAAPR